MDVAGTIKKILEITEFTQAELARKVAVTQGTISKWINDGHSPNLDQWDRVVRFMKRRKDLRELLEGDEETNMVPIMGRIGAGSEIEPDFEQVPPDGLEQIELPFDVPRGIVGFRVTGDSMRPVYKDGDAVLVWREQRRDPSTFIGEEAAVRTADGRRYLKEIDNGTKPGLFDLISHNAKTIRDQQIEWIGEIYITVRAAQIRRAHAGKAEQRASR